MLIQTPQPLRRFFDSGSSVTSKSIMIVIFVHYILLCKFIFFPTLKRGRELGSRLICPPPILARCPAQNRHSINNMVLDLMQIKHYSLKLQNGVVLNPLNSPRESLTGGVGLQVPAASAGLCLGPGGRRRFSPQSRAPTRQDIGVSNRESQGALTGTMTFTWMNNALFLFMSS